MATPLHTPRVNNNDDTVRLVHLFVAPGTAVRRGDPVADIETDKATFTVEAEQDGFVLAYNAKKGDTIEVGSVLAWIGSKADEPVPETAQQTTAQGTNGKPHRDGEPALREPTLKAAMLMAQYGIEAASLPGNGSRIGIDEVLAYIREHKISRGQPEQAPARMTSVQPAVEGRRSALTPEERGMLRTVEWHKREAVAAYAEVAYNEANWKSRAAEFKSANGLLLDPLLALLAWRLVQIARSRPKLNATIVDGEKYVYDHVNLGFTVQAGQNLYVAVVREAEIMSEIDFVKRLSELQRAAMKNSLRTEESSGATIGFTSMARWSVTRHIPILIPQTALIVAHAASRDGIASLGATYDHRLLTGGDVVIALNELASNAAESK